MHVVPPCGASRWLLAACRIKSELQPHAGGLPSPTSAQHPSCTFCSPTAPCYPAMVLSAWGVFPTAWSFQSHSSRLGLSIVFSMKYFWLFQAEGTAPSFRLPLQRFFLYLLLALVILYSPVWIYVLISLTTCFFQMLCHICLCIPSTGNSPWYVAGGQQASKRRTVFLWG